MNSDNEIAGRRWTLKLRWNTMCGKRSHKQTKVLVVDDEEAVRLTFDLALTGAGYEVFYAEQGEDALRILRDENLNVIFLDLNLPDMSGVELCRQICVIKPNASITAITGYASHFEIEACYQAGFDDYLEKPIGLDLLLTSVLKAFERTKKPGEAPGKFASRREMVVGK